MKIITVTGYKGGVAKSTTALHLATYFAESGGKVLVVDSDPNHSLRAWAERGVERGTPLPVRVVSSTEAVRESRGCDYVVFDTPAAPASEDLLEIARTSDLIILPTIPDATSILPMIDTLNAVDRAKSRIVLTIVGPGNDGRDALAELQGADYPVCSTMIRRSVAYARASVHGTTVRDLAAPELSRFWEDYRSLGQEIEGAL